MENNKKLLIILAVFVLVLVGAGLLYSQLLPRFQQDQLNVLTTQPTETTSETTSNTTPNTTPNTTAGTESQEYLAPDFTVYDAQGNGVRLSDYFSKPIVLNFWASWCGPCQSEMPDFDEKNQQLGGEVQFLMINMTDGDRETVDTAAAFIAKKGYTFPVFYDTQLEAAMTYGAYSLPMTFFINSQGELIARAVGAIDGETLQRGIDMIAD